MAELIPFRVVSQGYYSLLGAGVTYPPAWQTSPHELARREGSSCDEEEPGYD